MFDFIRKPALWKAWDEGYVDELEKKISYQLKIAQDLAIYSHLREKSGLKIAEIGGGDSRILRRLGRQNNCFNIEKFEGRDQGPRSEINIENVRNINAYIGDFDRSIEDGTFDVAFSVSVVEHIATDKLDAFFRDSLRILRPNGVFLHAIDMYLEAAPTAYFQERFGIYKGWVKDNPGIEPLGEILDGPLGFSPDMATNPDNILYGWGKLDSSLVQLRTRAQNVSLLVGGRKR